MRELLLGDIKTSWCWWGRGKGPFSVGVMKRIRTIPGRFAEPSAGYLANGTLLYEKKSDISRPQLKDRQFP